MSEPPEGPREPAGARQRVVDAFAHAARRATDMPGLQAHLGEAARALGFDYFLLQEASGGAWLAGLPAGWRVAASREGDAVLAAAHYVGALAFDAAENFLCASGPQAPPGPRLTPRQHACVALAAQGKSDWEIGQVLGISESTVHKHIEDAKRRFGVSTRIQLVVRSLFDAGLRFSDVMTDET